jgi:hypothetical protein
MQFLSLLLTVLPLTLALPSPQEVGAIKPPKDPYTCCRYPGWPTTVLNFEYPDQNPNHQTYHGLSWKNWAGYNNYPGYPTGWAPIPSNHTTLAAKAGPDKYQVFVGPGWDAFEDVISVCSFPPSLRSRMVFESC